MRCTVSWEPGPAPVPRPSAPTGGGGPLPTRNSEEPSIFSCMVGLGPMAQPITRRLKASKTTAKNKDRGQGGDVPEIGDRQAVGRVHLEVCRWISSGSYSASAGWIESGGRP